MLWSELCSPKIHLLNEFPTPNMTVFGDRTFNKIIKIKWSHEQSPNPTGLVTNFSLSLPNQPPPFPFPRPPPLPFPVCRLGQRRGQARTQQETATCKPGREPSPETNSNSILILDSYRTMRKYISAFKPSSLWYSVRAAQED